VKRGGGEKGGGMGAGEDGIFRVRGWGGGGARQSLEDAKDVEAKGKPKKKHLGNKAKTF